MKNDDEQFETLTQHISAVGSDVAVLKDAMYKEYGIAKTVSEKAIEAAQKVHDKMEYKFADVHEKLDNIVAQTTKTNGSVARSIEEISKLKGDKKYIFGIAAACLVLIPIVYSLVIDRVEKVEVTTDNLKSTTVTKEDLQNFKDDIKGLLQTYTSQISKMR